MILPQLGDVELDRTGGSDPFPTSLWDTEMRTQSLMTAAELAATGPETDNHELVRGMLQPVPFGSARHGVVCVNIAVLLHTYQKWRGSGCTLSNDVGFITEHDPDTVRGIDIAFFLNPPWDGRTPDTYIDEPPDLAVEVFDPLWQTWDYLRTKIDEYLHMGARMIWIVDFTTTRLSVFQPDCEPATFAAENEFDGGDVLPGLKFKVAEIFD